MSDIQVSLFGSFAHPDKWLKFFEGWRMNTVKYEIIVAGPHLPDFELPPEVRFIHVQPDPGPCHCAHIAARQCTGETMILLGDDCLHSPFYLDKMYAKHKEGNDYKCMPMPRWCGANGTKAANEMSDLKPENDITDSFWEIQKIPGRTDIVWGFPLWSRKFFWELGGFDRRFGGGPFEADLMLRAYSRGGWYTYVYDAFISEPLGPESRAWNTWHGKDDIETLMWQRWHSNSIQLGGFILDEPRTPFEPID